MFFESLLCFCLSKIYLIIYYLFSHWLAIYLCWEIVWGLIIVNSQPIIYIYLIHFDTCHHRCGSLSRAIYTKIWDELLRQPKEYFQNMSSESIVGVIHIFQHEYMLSKFNFQQVIKWQIKVTLPSPFENFSHQRATIGSREVTRLEKNELWFWNCIFIDPFIETC